MRANILQKLSSNFYATLLTILILLILTQILNVKIYHSLTNSLPQQFFVTTKSLQLQPVNRDDYIIFNIKNRWHDLPFVKKVIGLPNDHIATQNNAIWILPHNFEDRKKSQTFINGGIAKNYDKTGQKLNKIPVGIIPPGYYYVHAKHKNSLDSRYEEIGLIHELQIIAKVRPILAQDIFCLIIITFLLFIIFKIVAIYTVNLLTRNRLSFLVILFLAISLLPNNSRAKDFGVHGKIYEIKEVDLLTEIKDKLQTLEDSGELAKLQKEWQKKAIAKVNRPKPVSGLINATETAEFIYDPTIITQNDIYDHKGNIVVKRGTKINPLDYQDFNQTLLFIDGDNEAQIDWALKQARNLPKLHTATIILTKGAIMNLMRQYQTRLYFDQDGYLIKTFGIKALPAKIWQEGDKLRVREVAL